ncbi:MAG TPA: hypothetical protein VGH13_08165, partial [Xanthobacteraceae bacterium]
MAYSGNMAHAQHAARAMWEINCLSAYVTTYAFNPTGRTASFLARIPSANAKALLHQLSRRAVDQVPADLVHGYPLWEIVRSAAQKCGASPAVV